MKRCLFLLFIFSTAADAQYIHFSTGFTVNTSCLKQVNPVTGKFETTHSNKIVPDLNVLFETRRKNVLSFKTGIIIDPEFYEYKYYTSDHGIPPFYYERWRTERTNDEVIFIGIPLLLAANFTNNTIEYYFDSGLYLGRTFGPTIIGDGDAGVLIAGGLGWKKWQFRTYALLDFFKNNLEDNTGYIKGEGARELSFGLNLTRILQLKGKKKDMEN